MKKILIAILFLVACRADKEKAERSAESYADHIPGAIGTECVASDSDGDGYCSCTVFVKDGNHVPIECGCERHCAFNCAEGCKMTTYKVRK